MRVFVAGATGAIGRQLVGLLVAAGHDVTGMTRSPQKIGWLREAGAQAVVCDALDGQALADAVSQAQPDAVVHELTAIPPRLNPRKIERDFALTNRLRSEGTRNLVAAAQAAKAGRIVAQSVAFVYAPTGDGRLHEEGDPLMDPPRSFERTLHALEALEKGVGDAGGTVLRYGYFYGPGTAVAREGSLAGQARRRQLPVVGAGTGVWSFIHVRDAARATVAALEAPTGVYNVVDDDPAPVREWVPAFCEAVGAPRPLRVPTWLARIAAGGYGVSTMTAVEGASNARARRELGWSPAYASWREGFRTGLG
jgi:nucleoside-diphosphate-sugar epimerase